MRLPLYNKLGNLALEGIKNITGTEGDPHFVWPSDKQNKVIQNNKMPSIDSLTEPLEEDILYPNMVHHFKH